MGATDLTAHDASGSGVSRRRVLQALALTVAVTPLAHLTGGIDHAEAATPAWQPPPPYDSIVGLL